MWQVLRHAPSLIPFQVQIGMLHVGIGTELHSLVCPGACWCGVGEEQQAQVWRVLQYAPSLNLFE